MNDEPILEGAKPSDEETRHVKRKTRALERWIMIVSWMMKRMYINQDYE
jgi:hypothetical protein